MNLRATFLYPAHSMDESTTYLEFRFFEEEASDVHRVPAKVLADALTHAQRAVHLLALSTAGREIRQRARIPAELAQQFVLECELPAPGSYVQRVTLSNEADIVAMAAGDGVLSQFREIGVALSHSDWASVQTLVPDRRLRNRVVDEYVSMLPDPEEGWVVDMRNGAGRVARFDPRQIRTIREHQRVLRQPAGTLASPVTLTGELVGIDFAERKLTIRHHPTQRRLDCEYSDEVEEMLVENRRGMIQVSGLVELDEHDRPIRLTDVFDIQELDLSPIMLDRIEGVARSLRFKEGPYQFVPELDEDGQLLVIEDPLLDIHVFARTRDELLSDLVEQIEVLWLEYAEADTARLTEGASALSEILREQLELLPNAA